MGWFVEGQEEFICARVATAHGRTYRDDFELYLAATRMQRLARYDMRRIAEYRVQPDAATASSRR